MRNSLADTGAKTVRLAVLPLAWLAERDLVPSEVYADPLEGKSYRDILTTSVWMYLLYVYQAMVRDHFGDEMADAVWVNQQAMLEQEAAGAAGAFAAAFDLIESALQSAEQLVPSSQYKIDVPAELSVALALLLGLPESPGYRKKANGAATESMPQGIDWFLSTQLQQGREQLNREFAPVFSRIRSA